MSRDLEPSKRVPHLPDESPHPSRDLRFPGTYDRFARLSPIDGDEESNGAAYEEEQEDPREALEALPGDEESLAADEEAPGASVEQSEESPTEEEPADSP